MIGKVLGYVVGHSTAHCCGLLGRHLRGAKKKQTAELLNVVMHYLYGILNFDSAGECGVCGAAS